ncbi:MAG: acyl-CoA dehydrogenase [Candidatus Tectimicrobiota bacterium]|nr:MAG: acyl-CoA dehydrogenase [Candidatus Tectomicrobia bacterium]
MDFSWSPEEEAFRQEIRDFLQAELPKGWNETLVLDKESDEYIQVAREFTRKVGAKGWLAAHWPPEYGGLGWSFWQYFILQEELAIADAPIIGSNGPKFLGPTIIRYGTEEQKRRHLPGIAKGEVLWAQGYSEPNAGSDLASLQTRAVQDGDEWVINGQKIWSSYAHYADWCFLLARTDPNAPKHKGISYFLVDMKTPGITVKPLINMAGTKGFNEIFFENVRVPKDALLGEKNQGWYIATTTLSYERTAIEAPAQAQRILNDLIRYAKLTKRHGRTLAEDPLVRQRLAQIAVEIDVARCLAYRVASTQARGEIPGPESPANKLFTSELMQRLAQVGMQLLGLYGQLEFNSRWAPLKGKIERLYLTAVSRTIAAGTSEIQRNIIAERGLGLPR